MRNVGCGVEKKRLRGNTSYLYISLQNLLTPPIAEFKSPIKLMHVACRLWLNSFEFMGLGDCSESCSNGIRLT